MKILLLSAYDAASHRHWSEMLMQHFKQDQWTVLQLPARYFSWRVRGNSLSWAFSERDVLSQGYDLVIATSMVDLSRGTRRQANPGIAFGKHTNQAKKIFSPLRKNCRCHLERTRSQPRTCKETFRRY